MTNIIRLHRDPHRETQRLLPWYVTDKLDPAERGDVESHLETCAECREELAFERALGSKVAGLPVDAGSGWLRLHRRLALNPQRESSPRRAGHAIVQALAWPGKFGWLLAGQAVLAASLALVLLPQGGPPAPYRTLGSTAERPQANVIVIFRPDTSEADMRQTLNDGRARLIDGPTASGAYLLHVPGAERGAILAMLRARPDIVLAQPVDAEGQP